MSDDVRIFIGSSSNGEDAPIEAAYAIANINDLLNFVVSPI